MKTRDNSMVPNRNIIRIVLGAALVLLVPFLVMLFYGDMVWGPADFALVFALLVATGLTYELVVKKVKSVKSRAILGIVLVALLLLVWIEIAVGIFGTPLAGD